MKKQNTVFIIPSAICGGHEFQTVALINDHCQRQDSMPLILAGSAKFLELLPPHQREKAHYLDFPQGNIIQLFLNIKHSIRILKPFIAQGSNIVIAGGTVEPVIYYSLIIKYLMRIADVDCCGYIPMYVDKRLLRPTLGCLHNLLLDSAAGLVDRFITINKIQAKIISYHFRRPVAITKNRVNHYPKVTVDHGPRLIYCGRLDDGQKNVTQLVRMLDDVRNPYTKLLIIGDGPARANIEKIVAECQYLSVTLFGWKSPEEMQAILGINDVLIMNSRWEGEPLVVREFASRGIPTIAPDIPGFRVICNKGMRFSYDNELYNILKHKFPIKFIQH